MYAEFSFKTNIGLSTSAIELADFSLVGCNSHSRLRAGYEASGYIKAVGRDSILPIYKYGRRGVAMSYIYIYIYVTLTHSTLILIVSQIFHTQEIKDAIMPHKSGSILM